MGDIVSDLRDAGFDPVSGGFNCVILQNASRTIVFTPTETTFCLGTESMVVSFHGKPCDNEDAVTVARVFMS